MKNFTFFQDVPKRIYWIGFLVSCIPILVMLYCHLTRPSGWHFNWELQNDQYYYAANARAIFEHGNGFAYSNPFDSNPNPPVIYSHLFSLLLAYTWKLTCLPIMFAYFPLRIIFGVLLTVSIWKIVNALFKEKHIINLCFYCLLFAGGIAGVISLFNLALGNIPYLNFIPFFQHVEGFSTWCFLDLFRNFFYSTEIVYHFLFFVTLWCVFKSYWRSSLIFFALTLYAHPYNGLQLALTYLLYLFLSFCLGDKTDRKQYFLIFMAALSIFIFFLYYNLIWLKSFPEHAKIMKIVAAEKFIIDFRGLMVGCGIWLVLGVFGLIRFLKPLLLSKEWRLIVCLFMVTMLLMHHHLFSEHIIQPAHFSRGYPHFCLVLFVFYYLQQNPSLNRFLAGVWKKTFLCVFMVLFLALDNIIFLPIAYKTDLPAIRYMPHSGKEVMDFLAKRKENDVVAVNNRHFGYLIPVFTHQKAEISYEFLTPEFHLKRKLLFKLINNGDTTFLERYKNTNLIVLTKEEQLQVEKYPFFFEWKKLYENTQYVVFLIRAS